jgi:hypothetical protein
LVVCGTGQHLDGDVFLSLGHHQAYGRRVAVGVLKPIVHRAQAVLHQLKHLRVSQHSQPRV